MPVPGSPTVVRVPLFPKVIHDPRLPTEVDTPAFDTFRRSPDAILKLRRNRNPMFSATPTRLALQRPPTSSCPAGTFAAFPSGPDLPVLPVL